MCDVIFLVGLQEKIELISLGSEMGKYIILHLLEYQNRAALAITHLGNDCVISKSLTEEQNKEKLPLLKFNKNYTNNYHIGK